jgi:hypothetical protein
VLILRLCLLLVIHTRCDSGLRKEMTTNHTDHDINKSLAQRLQSERELIYHRITTLREEIRRVYTSCNMKATINLLLPREVLSRIFAFLLDISTVNWPYMRTYPASLRISHVCTYWREVALSHPYLWTKGFPVNVDGFQTFMQRSKQMPIHFDYGTIKRLLSVPAHHSILFSNLCRAYEFHYVTQEGTRSLIKMINALDVAAPRLEVLVLGMGEYTYSTPRPPILLSEAVDVTQLRMLRLQACALRWDRVELQNLSSLDLTGTFEEDEKMTLQQLLAILQRSPRLKNLQLVHVIGDDHLNHDLSLEVPSLPELEYLRIKSKGLTITKLLFRDPSTLGNVKSLHINVQANDEVSTPTLLLAATSLPHFRRPHHIGLGCDRHSTVKGFSYAQHNEYQRGRTTFTEKELSFKSVWESDGNIQTDFSELYASCMKQQDLKDLVDFSYEVNYFPPTSWWIDVLEEMTSVTRFYIDTSANVANVLDALTPFYTDEDNDSGYAASDGQTEAAPSPPAPVVLLPRLREFHLSTININNSDLEACVNLRYENHCPLGKIKLPGISDEYDMEFNEYCEIVGEDDPTPEPSYSDMDMYDENGLEDEVAFIPAEMLQ